MTFFCRNASASSNENERGSNVNDVFTETTNNHYTSYVLLVVLMYGSCNRRNSLVQCYVLAVVESDATTRNWSDQPI